VKRTRDQTALKVAVLNIDVQKLKIADMRQIFNVASSKSLNYSSTWHCILPLCITELGDGKKTRRLFKEAWRGKGQK